ncbi:MAG: tetratricopeptide repeat protein [Alphaproteobacteria bacterium]
MSRLFLAAGLALGVLVPQSALAASSVFGGGMAEACSKAAVRGEVEAQYEKLCTESLQTEFLDTRDRAGTFVNRGVLRLRRAKYDDATKDFNDALRLSPDMGEAFVNRGAALVGRHQFAEALVDINKAITLGIDEPAKAYYNRALAYEGLDNLKAAYFDYRKALEINPDWEPPKKELARFSVAQQP